MRKNESKNFEFLLSSVKRNKPNLKKKLTDTEIYKNYQESNTKVNKYLVVRL